MTPDQWWALYGNDLGAEDEWSTGTLAVIDQTWSDDLIDVVSPYTHLMGGGWDVGSSVVLDLLTIDWSNSSAVGTLICNLVGSVVGEAIGALAGGIPLIGAVGGIVYDLIAMGAKQEAEEAAQRAADLAQRDRDCAVRARDLYDVRGSGPASAVLPCDWWIQADLGADMRPEATGRCPSIGQTFDAMLTSWPCWQVEDALIYCWNTYTTGWPRDSYPTIADFYRATIGAAGESEVARWYESHRAADRWSSSWLAVPRSPRPYRAEWPQWQGLSSPLAILRNAIADQSAALRPRDYVDGGRMLQPLWLDFWRQLTKVEIQSPTTPNTAPVAAMPFELLKSLYRTGSSATPTTPWGNGAMAFTAANAPPSPFVPCGNNATGSLGAIESMIDAWSTRVFPAYGPDKSDYMQQLSDAWAALDEHIRASVTGTIQSIGSAAMRAGRTSNNDRLISDAIAERLVHSGAMSADAALGAIDRDEQARAARRYSFMQAAGLGIGGAAIIGALLWRP